jgi:hypothetical protein
MRLEFERGDPDRPGGHALIYFRSTLDPDVVVATYVIVPPIVMDFAKYVPPMFAAQFGSMVNAGPSVVPLPPVPEKVESLTYVRHLAQARGDDLIDGGRVDVDNIERMLSAATDAASEYGRLYHARDLSTLISTPIPTPFPMDEPAALPDIDVDELFYSVMTEQEKVGRIAKLVGTVRYAVEGGDVALLGDTLRDMQRIAKFLPAEYRATELMVAVQQPGDDGGRLTTLLVQRCYKLAAGESAEVATLDAQIREAAGE